MCKLIKIDAFSDALNLNLEIFSKPVLQVSGMGLQNPFSFHMHAVFDLLKNGFLFLEIKNHVRNCVLLRFKEAV